MNVFLPTLSHARSSPPLLSTPCAVLLLFCHIQYRVSLVFSMLCYVLSRVASFSCIFSSPMEVSAVVFNLINLFVGSGLLSIPYAFATIGWVSPLALLGTAVLYWHCFSRLTAVVLAHHEERANFADLMAKVFGRWCVVVHRFSVSANCPVLFYCLSPRTPCFPTVTTPLPSIPSILYPIVQKYARRSSFSSYAAVLFVFVFVFAFVSPRTPCFPTVTPLPLSPLSQSTPFSQSMLRLTSTCLHRVFRARTVLPFRAHFPRCRYFSI